MFVVGQKTSKSAKIFTLENFSYTVFILWYLSLFLCVPFKICKLYYIHSLGFSAYMIKFVLRYYVREKSYSILKTEN